MIVSLNPGAASAYQASKVILFYRIERTPERCRCLAALHRELARQSANANHFLSCRDAAHAHPTLNKDPANQINHALAQLGVIALVRIDVARPGGPASEFRYLFPQEVSYA
jgi:hypothetical protein